VRRQLMSAVNTGSPAKYGGLEVSDAKRLKALEDENAKLKKLLAEAMLDNAMLKDVASKKW
jgi:putative transposase